MRRTGTLLVVATVILGSVLLVGCGGEADAPTAMASTSSTVAPTSSTVASSTTTTTAAPTTTVAVPAEAWTESGLVLFRRVSDGATLTLDMYFPAEPEEAPIVIGSGATNDLVDEGMIVVDIADDDHLGEGPGGPEEIVADRAFVRGSAERLACAIRLARAKAAEVGNDDPTVVLTGVSFGGGLAVQVALFGDTLDRRWEEFAASGGPPRQFDCEVTGGSTDVDVVIGQAGTYDLSMPIFEGTYGRAYQQEHDPEMQEFLASAIGANPELKVRLIHGTVDDIPVEYAEEFARVLTDLGYDAQLITWPGGHAAAPRELFLSTLEEALGQ